MDAFAMKRKGKKEIPKAYEYQCKSKIKTHIPLQNSKDHQTTLRGEINHFRTLIFSRELTYCLSKNSRRIV